MSKLDCRNNLQDKHQALKPLLPARPLHQPSASFQLRTHDKHSRLCWPGSEMKDGPSGVTMLNTPRGEALKSDVTTIPCNFKLF